MLTLLDNAGTYELPTGWHEVSTAQFCELDRLQLRTVEARASYFAGRPIQVNALVADVLAFLLHAPPTAGGLEYPRNLGDETFLQVESIRALLTTQPLCECYHDVYGLFVTRCRAWRFNEFRPDLAAVSALRCAGYAVTDTYPAVAHCVAELARLDASYAELSEPDETEAGRAARAAGSELLAPFGHLNTARHYAEVFHTTIEEIYQRPWQEIAVFLLMDRRSAIIRDNLSRNQSKPASHDE